MRMDGYYRSPYRAGNPLASVLRQTPPVTRALIVACTAIFVVQLLVDYGTSGVGTRELLLTLGLVPQRFLHGYVHQAVTYAFLHGGFGHLLFNMLSLWMFGSEMERLWGGGRFTRYYAICGIGAALTTVAADWRSIHPTIGASGAILGLLLAYGLTFPTRTVLLYFVIPVSARVLVILTIVLQVFFYREAMGSGIAVWAHLGGMLFGWLALQRWRRPRAILNELRWRIRRRRFRVMPRKGNGDPGMFH